MKYFRNLFFRDEQQTNKYSSKPYAVTYTTQDFGLRQSRKQDLLPSFEPLSFNSSSVSTTKEPHTEVLLYSEDEEELGIQCLNPGTSHTYGKVISSSDSNVSLHFARNTGKRVPISKTIDHFDCREENPRLSKLVEIEEEIALIEDDWIVLNAVPKANAALSSVNNQLLSATKRLHQMALNETEQNLIKASWVPMREDPETAGLLLFDG